MIRVKEAITAGQHPKENRPASVRGRVGWSQSISLAAPASKANRHGDAAVDGEIKIMPLRVLLTIERHAKRHAAT